MSTDEKCAHGFTYDSVIDCVACTRAEVRLLRDLLKRALPTLDKDIDHMNQSGPPFRFFSPLATEIRAKLFFLETEPVTAGKSCSDCYKMHPLVENAGAACKCTCHADEKKPTPKFDEESSKRIEDLLKHVEEREASIPEGLDAHEISLTVAIAYITQSRVQTPLLVAEVRRTQSKGERQWT